MAMDLRIIRKLSSLELILFYLIQTAMGLPIMMKTMILIRYQTEEKSTSEQTPITKTLIMMD